MAMAPRVRANGVTLIEMVIVLTVFALIIGAVLIGRGILRQAEIQSLISDVDRYAKAVALYQDKYGNRPGDDPAAATRWGKDTWCSTASMPNTELPVSMSGQQAAFNTRKKATCGGNGNGFLGSSQSGSSFATPLMMHGGSNEFRESTRAWQHLANSGFVPGTFSGVSSIWIKSPDTQWVTWVSDAQAPRTSVHPKAGFTYSFSHPIDSMNRDPGGTAHSGAYPGQYGHLISYRGPGGSSNAQIASLSALDAADIDNKIDDGLPGTGSLRAPTPHFSLTPNCASSADPAAAHYKTAHEGLSCILIFVIGP